MIGSRMISMTLVPIMAAAFFKGHNHAQKPKGILGMFNRGFENLTNRYTKMVDKTLKYRWWVLGSVTALFAVSMFGFTKVGTELFPQMDVGQISMDVRMESGTRIEKAEETVTAIEHFLKQEIGEDANLIVSNMGVLNDWPAAYTNNSGTQDATIAVQLEEGHKTKTADYIKTLRPKLKEKFPGVQFIFNTGGIVTSALNFGLPSPIDVQIIGNDLHKTHEIAVKVREIIRKVEGTEDVRIHQRYDHPEIKVEIDRTKAAMVGVNAEETVKNIVSALNSSVNFKPSFWIDERNGNHYFIGVTYPEIELDNPQSVENIGITGTNGKVTQLKNIAKTSLTSAPIEINHLNLQRVTDVYANVEGRDIGSVAAEIEEQLEILRKDLPEGYKIVIRGEMQSMNEGFGNLGLGLVLAILLVYLVIVPLLRSFKLPLIIITVIPLGLIGVTAMLLATDTYLNIQSMMGIIMMVGITVAYSNLLVDKMNNLLKEGKPLNEAIKEGVANRFRPILMTALVTVFALLPLAIGYETGGEANVPLARAIIGGVLTATLLSLFIVPTLFFLLTKKSEIKMNSINSVISIILIPFFLSLLSSCGKKSEEQQTQTQSGNTPIVLVSQPVKHEYKAVLQIAGTAKPNQQVKLFAMTNGYLQKLSADIGDFVKESQTLAVLENPELFSEKSKLEAELKGKKSIYERLKSIYEKTPQLTTIADVEKAEAEYESIKAQLNAIQQQIDFLIVKAPFPGIVINRFVDKGSIVQSGLNHSNAMPLFEIQDLQPIRLTVEVPEMDATLIQKGTKVTVTFPELPNETLLATVSRIAYGLNEATRTMKVEIDLPNKDLKIRSGMYAKVAIEKSGHKGALSVPNEAISNVKGQSFIYVVNNGTVKKVEVKTGIRDDQFTELLSGEIQTTDSIVVKGKEFCFDGAIVQTKVFSSQ